MPLKSTSSKKTPRKKPQNSRQIRKPTRKSNENPCLNPDDSQVGRAIEQTEEPGFGFNKVLSVMYEEEMLDSDESDVDDAGSGYEQPPYNDRHDGQPEYQSAYHPQHELQRPIGQPEYRSAYHPQLEHQMLNHLDAPHFQPQYTQHPVPFLPSFTPQAPLPQINQPLFQMDHNPFQHHRTHMDRTQSPQRNMTAEDLFLGCSVDAPLPPTVRGADRLSRHLQDPQARSMRSSPYAFPGLRKVTVFGPRRQDEHYRGEWQNTGVVHAGSSKQIAQKRPTAKDLPPRPLPPSNVSVTSAHQCAPPHPHPPAQALPHSHPPAQSHDDGGSDRQAGPPIPVPAEHIDDVCASARSRMRRAVLSVNGMPTNDNNIAMARAALAEAIANIQDVPPGQYYLPDEKSFISSLTKITGTIRTTMKSAARVVAHHKYDLGLDIWDTLSEVAHKLRIVPSLLTHLQCLFISKNIMLDGTLQSVAVLEHDALISLVIDILWIHGFYKDIDFDDPKALDGVIALAGAALCSALMEYKTGVYKRVQFSTAKSEATYRSILTYISDKIYPRAELAARFKALKAKIKERGESRLGL